MKNVIQKMYKKNIIKEMEKKIKKKKYYNATSDEDSKNAPKCINWNKDAYIIWEASGKTYQKHMQIKLVDQNELKAQYVEKKILYSYHFKNEKNEVDGFLLFIKNEKKKWIKNRWKQEVQLYVYLYC